MSFIKSQDAQNAMLPLDYSQELERFLKNHFTSIALSRLVVELLFSLKPYKTASLHVLCPWLCSSGVLLLLLFLFRSRDHSCSYSFWYTEIGLPDLLTASIETPRPLSASPFHTQCAWRADGHQVGVLRKRQSTGTSWTRAKALQGLPCRGGEG